MNEQHEVMSYDALRAMVRRHRREQRRRMVVNASVYIAMALFCIAMWAILLRITGIL
jgi:hypothetical protein